MIDEQIDRDFESLLKSTLDEMIPKAQAAASTQRGGAMARRLDVAELSRVIDVAHAPTRQTSRRYVGIAAAILAAVSIAGIVVARDRNRGGSPAASTPSVDAPAVTATSSDPSVSGPEPSPEATAIPGGAAAETVAIPAFVDYGPPPFDPIRIEPDTTGWYEAGLGTPADVLAQVGDNGDDSPAITADYLANFYRCEHWTLDDNGPICDQLGGAASSAVNYGSALSIGTTLDSDDPVGVVRQLADGALWGYDSGAMPDQPTPVSLARATGYVYRNNEGAAYLAWQQAPGVVVNLYTQSLDDATLIKIADGVMPVVLPTTMPLRLSVDPVSVDPTGHDSTYSVAWLDGQPCAGFQMYTQCTRLDGTALTSEKAAGSDPRVLAITPTDSGLKLRVTLFGGAIATVDPVDNGLGAAVATYAANNERILSASLVDPSGALSQTIDLPVSTMLNGMQPNVIAEGRTSDRSWVVIQQTGTPPAAESEGSAPITVVYAGSAGAEPNGCVILVEANSTPAVSPLCPDVPAPSAGLGRHADYHTNLDLIEIGPDVVQVTCGSELMPTFADPTDPVRRFVVSSCPDPVATTG